MAPDLVLTMSAYPVASRKNLCKLPLPTTRRSPGTITRLQPPRQWTYPVFAKGLILMASWRDGLYMRNVWQRKSGFTKVIPTGTSGGFIWSCYGQYALSLILDCTPGVGRARKHVIILTRRWVDRVLSHTRLTAIPLCPPRQPVTRSVC